MISPQEGFIFEINNAIPHRVVNNSPRERVHLLLDWSEEERQHRQLEAGSVCTYRNGGIHC